MYAHGIIRQILSLTIARKQSVSLAFGRKEKFYWLLEERIFNWLLTKNFFYLFKVLVILRKHIRAIFSNF